MFHLVFRNYDPHFIAGSLDEAYLDITEVCRERGLSGGEVSVTSSDAFFVMVVSSLRIFLADTATVPFHFFTLCRLQRSLDLLFIPRLD